MLPPRRPAAPVAVPSRQPPALRRGHALPTTRGAVVVWAASAALALGCRGAPSGPRATPTGPTPPGGPAVASNPIIQDRYTADPAALVHAGRLYLYVGHDEAAPDGRGFVMRDWRLYTTTDLARWEPAGAPLAVRDFRWASGDAWAAQVIERDGRFYWYVTARHATVPGFAIGVAVADRPEGPFVDARGSALVTNDMTRGALLGGREIDWDDIDPTVAIDDDGQAYLFWGNTKLRYARLKPNMTELDGPIVDVDLPQFTEAPWLHRRGGVWYLSYAHGFPERIAYATAPGLTGPWTFRGVINDTIPRSPTNHQAIVEFAGRWWFFYHTAALPGGGEFRRSVSVEELVHEPDGSIRPIRQTLAPRPPLTAGPPAPLAPAR